MTLRHCLNQDGIYVWEALAYACKNKSRPHDKVPGQFLASYRSFGLYQFSSVTGFCAAVSEMHASYRATLVLTDVYLSLLKKQFFFLRKILTLMKSVILFSCQAEATAGRVLSVALHKDWKQVKTDHLGLPKSRSKSLSAKTQSLLLFPVYA